jgi:two-component system cell cycle response regulator
LERVVASGSFLRKNFFLIVGSIAYLEAAISPVWGLDWRSPYFSFWSAFILFLLVAGLWRLLRPRREYPSTDIFFILSLIIAVNLFSNLLGPARHWLQPMNYLVVALSALYYSLGFNFLTAGLILLLEGLNMVFLPGSVNTPQLVNLLVFGGYLAGTVLVLGRLLQSEHKRKERAILAVRRLEDGAHSMDNVGTDASLKSISPEGRASLLVESAQELDRVLSELLATARAAIPSANNAVIFMAGSDGGSVYPRVHTGDGEVLEDSVIPVGQGLVGWVAREKRPVLVVENARGLGYLRDDETPRSFVAAPILSGNFLEGIIALDSVIEGSFGETDKEALARFADIAMHLLQNARAYQQVDMSAKHFAALHTISAEVSSSLDLKTILERLAQFSRDIIPYDYLTISLTEGDDAVVFKTTIGYEGQDAPSGPVPLAGSLLAWIVENRQPLCFTDLDRRTERLPIFPAGMLKSDCKSFLGLPFISQDKVLGVFTVALKEPGAISAYQNHMLSIIANQVAVNITNARLHHLMSQMATTDGLTTLINHRHFQEKADEAFARAARYPEPLSLLLFDIDRFKDVNDTYGHPVGDAVLKKVAKILKDAVRSVDIAARYGGEEFVALLSNTDANGARQMAERVRTTIEKSRFMLSGRNIPITMSVGYATYPADADSKKELIEKADQALYWAKGHGRNQSCSYGSIPGDLETKKG